MVKLLLLLTLAGVICTVPAVHDPVAAQTQTRAGHYVCPMHPDVTSSKPGKCPKCKMALRFTRAKSTKSAAREKPAADSDGGSSMTIPDVIVKDQNGKSLNFYRDLVKGKVVAVNFVFTTCTAICPSLTATFRRVQQQLAEEKVSAQLISISVDPTTDTPERLQEFAAKFNAEPGWTFVTGNTADIDLILKEFGVAAANKNDHSPMILIGNEAAGYWTRAYGLSSPTSLVKLIALAARQK